MGAVFVKLIFLISIFGVCSFIINKFIREWLNVEKKKIFSDNFVNDTHRKIERIIGITFICFVFIGVLINISREPLKPIWFLETQFLLFAFIIVLQIVRIIMGKRYAENKNDYIFSAIQLVAISIFILLAYFLVLKDL